MNALIVGIYVVVIGSLVWPLGSMLAASLHISRSLLFGVMFGVVSVMLFVLWIRQKLYGIPMDED